MSISEKNIIENTIVFVKSELKNAESGHDWWHIYRVLQLTRIIAAKENADEFICQLGALLHDISDLKFHARHEKKSMLRVTDFLKGQGLNDELTARITGIIRGVSFGGRFRETQDKSLELKVVQDADRLDAMGAIGIARAFHYGGYKNRPIYDPSVKPKKYSSEKDYRSSESPSINHFFEKLLLLKDLMNTPTARFIAEDRHRFLEMYLDQFFREWAW